MTFHSKLQMFIFSCTILLFIRSTSQQPNFQQPDKAYFNLISTILHQRFATCSRVITYTDPGNTVEKEFYFSTINHLLEQDSSPADYFLIELPLNPRNSSNDNHMKQRRIQANNYDQLHDVHQHRPKCTLVVFMIYHKIKNLVDSLYTRSSKWTGILKKDHDFYLFLTNEPKTTDEVLLSSLFALGIKYKMVIEYPTSPTGSPLMKGSCHYCNDGNPQLVTFSEFELELDPAKLTQDQLSFADPTSSSILYKSKSTLMPKPDFGINFHGRRLKVSCPSSTRWLIQMEQIGQGWRAKRGLYKEVMEQLMVKYNFTYEIFPSTGGGTGGIQNGTWVGSVGDVLSGLADIGQTTGHSWSRNKVVGFTHSLSYEKLTYTSGIPPPFFTWKSMFWPLSPTVWIYLGLTYLFSLLMFHLFVKANSKNSKTSYKLSETVAFLSGSLLEQDIPLDKLSGKPIRIFLVIWLLSTLVITTAYRSKLMSFLAFPNREELPRSFEELANSNFKYALQYISGAAYAILKTSVNPTYKKIFKNMELEPDDVGCFQRAVGQRFVCISWSGTADFIFQRNLTGPGGQLPLVKSSDTTYFLAVGILTKKRDIFQEDFNRLIRNAHSSGLMIQWNEMDFDFIREERMVWERETQFISNFTYGEASQGALTIKHFSGAFYLLLLGLSLGCVVFAGEKIITRRSEQFN